MPTIQEQIKELDGRLAERREALHAIFEEAGPEMDLDKVKSIPGDKAAKLAEIRTKNTEIDAISKELEDKRDLLKAVENAKPRAKEGEPEEEPKKRGERPKSIGELFVESAAYKLRSGTVGPEATLDIELKTLMETGAGWAPEATRSGLLVLDEQRPIQVTDLIPSIPTSQNAYVYMEETTFTNNAAEAAEGAQYGEAALALTERTSPVRKIGVFLPVTDEQLEDVPGVRAYIDQRLPFMVRQRLDGQILMGDGNAPNLRGVNNVSGVQTQAKGTDPVPDALHKAITKVRVTGRATPTAIVFHPNDWQDIRLLRTADGVYIWGNPSDAGPERIWGLRVVQADAQAENTAVVGDWAGYSLLVVRRGIDVQISNSHSDFFIKGKQAIRADMRAAVVFSRPTAFCLVTGI